MSGSLPAARRGDALRHSGSASGALAGAGVGLAVALLVVGTGGGGLALLAIANGAGFGLMVGKALGGLLSSADGSILTGSPDVHIDGRPAARALDAVGCHPGEVIRCGAERIGINGRPAARKTDATRCAGSVDTGSAAVVIGGPTAEVLAERYGGELPAWLHAADTLLMVAGTAQLGWNVGRGLSRFATRTAARSGAGTAARALPPGHASRSVWSAGAPDEAAGALKSGEIKLSDFDMVRPPAATPRLTTTASARAAGRAARLQSPTPALDRLERNLANARARGGVLQWADLGPEFAGSAQRAERTIRLNAASSAGAEGVTNLAHELTHLRTGMIRNVQRETDRLVAELAEGMKRTGEAGRRYRSMTAPRDVLASVQKLASADWTDEGAAFLTQLKVARELETIGNPGVLKALEKTLGGDVYSKLVELERRHGSTWEAQKAFGKVLQTQGPGAYKGYPLGVLGDLENALKEKGLLAPLAPGLKSLTQRLTAWVNGGLKSFDETDFFAPLE